MLPTKKKRAESKRVTIYEVARESGLSTATVSKVMSNELREPIRPETIRHVREVAERLGYKPNRFAQSLRMQQSKFTGISQPHFLVDGKLPDPAIFSEMHASSSSSIGMLLIGATSYFSMAGYTSVFMPRSEMEAQPLPLEQVYLDILDGLLYIAPSYRHQEYLQIYESNKNIVLLGRCPDNPNISSADIDNMAECNRLTKHLIRSGAKHLALILPYSEENVALQDRHQGYQAALREAGLSYNPQCVLFQNDNPHFDEEVLEFLHDHPEVDGVIAGMGTVADSVIKACGRLNRRIPEDLLLASFDIMFKQRYCAPTVTSIELPYFEMAQEGARILVETINHQITEPTHTILPATLAIRESSIRR